jgi:hypothetical protein
VRKRNRLPDYLQRNDPGLQLAMEESAWASFLEALEKSTPGLMESLKSKPLEALKELADAYGEISAHKFGAITCIWDDKPALTAHPLGDLARLLRQPDTPQPTNPWPPSLPFWDRRIRSHVLQLASTMSAWSNNFRDEHGQPHLRLLNAALGTMHAWIEEPNLISDPHWIGHAKVVAYQSYQAPIVNFQLPSWNPLKETDTAFQERVARLKKELTKWARGHVREVRRMFVKSDTKRNPEHYHWSALRLSNEFTFRQIADHWGTGHPDAILDEGTIRKGVKTSLSVLGLRDVAAKRK